jgi:hypothetical protein
MVFGIIPEHRSASLRKERSASPESPLGYQRPGPGYAELSNGRAGTNVEPVAYTAEMGLRQEAVFGSFQKSRMFHLRLLNFKNGGLGEFVKGKTLSLAIEGSRRFRPPRALGLMRYEGCLIMVFVPTVSLDRAAFMRAHLEYLCGVPSQHVAVVAANLDYLVVLLDRMQETPGTRLRQPAPGVLEASINFSETEAIQRLLFGQKDGSPAWIRTTIHGSKGRCPTIRRPGISRWELTAPV